MPSQARVCRYCRRLIGVDATECHNCGARQPSPLARRMGEWVTTLFGAESPMVVMTLAFCLIVFLATLAPGFAPNGDLYTSQLLRWGMYRDDVVSFEPWRYLSAVYAHGGILHFALNAFALFRFGRELESRIGSARYLIVFVVSGVLGFVASGYFTNTFYTLGASGSIFGLMGAFVGYLLVSRDPDWKKWAVQTVLFAAILAVALDNINNAAHFGGAIAGFFVAFALYKVPRDWRYERVLALVALMCFVASVGSVYACATSPLWEKVRMAEVQAGLWD